MAARWRRRLRWLAGRGWAAQDFAARYAGQGDVWGYRGDPSHEQRARWILDALPQARFASALEAGCAQGFLTERLAPRVDRLIACDIAAPAVEATRAACRAYPHVETEAADIRAGLPGDNFDLCLFSDVLYYLSAREITSVLRETAAKTRDGGVLAIANEWRDARGPTPPAEVTARLDASPDWRRLDGFTRPFGGAELSLALYRRINAT